MNKNYIIFLAIAGSFVWLFWNYLDMLCLTSLVVWGNEKISYYLYTQINIHKLVSDDSIVSIENFRQSPAYGTVNIVVLVFFNVVFLVPLSTVLYLAAKEITYFGHLYSNQSLNSVLMAKKQFVWRILHSYSINSAVVSQYLHKLVFNTTNSTIVEFIGRITQNILISIPKVATKIFYFYFAWIAFINQSWSYRQKLLYIAIPWEAERTIFQNTVTRILNGLLVSNILVGTLQMFAFALLLYALQLPGFAIFGVIAFFFSFVPLIGTAPVLLVACIELLYVNNYDVCVTNWLIFIAGSICIVCIDNILRPWLIKGRVPLSVFWIIFSISCGVSQFGLVGFLLGPFICVLLQEWVFILYNRFNAI
jgi:predicted PurR-regulated permease PerM